jgi:hypothetical protein
MANFIHFLKDAVFIILQRKVLKNKNESSIVILVMYRLECLILNKLYNEHFS